MLMPTYTLRPATAGDYESAAALLTLVRPEQPLSADDLRRADATLPAHVRFGRWVVQDSGGALLGVGWHIQYADLYDPLRHWISIFVHPDHRRAGIGTALFRQLYDALAAYQPVALKSYVRETRPEGIAFAQHHSFQEVSRRFEARLDLTRSDLDTLLPAMPDLASVRIVSFAELADDPQRDVQFHALNAALDRDVPIGEPVTPMPFEQFQQAVLQDPAFVAEGTFVALDGARYVGLSTVTRTDSGRGLYIDMTGVHADYRGRGIALALKLRGIHYARQHGYETMVVMNDSGNAPMLRVNEQLGYVRQAAILKMERAY